MMKLTYLSIICLFAAGAGSFPSLAQSAEESTDEAPFAGQPAPEEMKILALLVGEWTTEIVARPSLTAPEGFKAKGRSRSEWTLNGHFLRIEATSVSERGKTQLTVLTTYNARAKQFRQFTFSSDGVAGETVGTWDEKTRTITWESVNLPGGWTGTGKTVLDEEHPSNSILVKNERGETIRDMIATGTRAK